MNASPLPRIAVATSKFIKGCGSVAEAQEDREALIILPFDEAFKTKWESDAHFVQYDCPADERFPRLRKEILEELRTLDCEVTLQVLALDVDRTDAESVKVTWASRAEASNGLAEFLGSSPRVPTLAYTTRHGLRLVFVTSRPMCPEEAEQRLVQLHKEFAAAGVPVDGACKDWPRLFRLPSVNRDGAPTWLEDYWADYEDLDLRLDLDGMPPLDHVPLSGGASCDPPVLGGQLLPSKERPEADDAKALLAVPSKAGGKSVQTEACKAAKKALRGCDCYACVFEGAPLARPLFRNTTIQRFVGQAVSLLHRYGWASQELVYALFLDACMELDPDEQTPDWRDVVWAAVQKYWAKDKQAEERRARENRH